jgi:hypothetical protein
VAFPERRSNHTRVTAPRYFAVKKKLLHRSRDTHHSAGPPLEQTDKQGGMNFCGADYDVHLLDQATAKVVTTATLCGPCVKEDEQHLDSLFTDEEDDDELLAQPNDEKALKEPRDRGSLGDSSNQSPPWRSMPRGPTGIADPVHAICTPSKYTRQQSTPTPPSDGQRPDSLTLASTPSPMYLNPITTPDPWQHTSHLKANKASTTALLCPTLEPSSTADKLSERLKRGFKVSYCHDRTLPASFSTTSRVDGRMTMVPTVLYLDECQRSLCLKISDGAIDSSAPFVRLLISKILRMEIGSGTARDEAGSRNAEGAVSTRHPCCFSIIVNHDARICYHDFEAGSATERELIVSTLLVVLDRLQKRAAPAGDDLIVADDGTEEQPIPCSPSLDQHELLLAPANAYSDRLQSGIRDDAEGSRSVIHIQEAHAATLDRRQRLGRRLPGRLPRRQIESYRSKSSSPKTRREKIFRQASEGYGTQAHPIDAAAAEAPLAKSRLRKTTQDVLISPRNSPDILEADRESLDSASLPEVPAIANRTRQRHTDVVVQPTVEDLIVEFAASGHLSPWCADDACALTLKDLADTCSNIFASGPGYPNSICHIPGGLYEQQRMLEEYIASALGAPSAFYSYLTEGQRWSSEITGKNGEASRLSGAHARIRNRSSVLNAQARRLRRLKGEMTFSAAVKKSQEALPYVHTSRSFNEESIYRRQAKVAEEGASQFHSSVLFQHVIGSAHAKPDLLLPEEDEVAYYDSDPEDARSQSLFRKCPRQIAAQYKNRAPPATAVPSFPTPVLAESGFGKVKSIRRVSKKLEEDVIIQIVQVRPSLTRSIPVTIALLTSRLGCCAVTCRP